MNLVTFHNHNLLIYPEIKNTEELFLIFRLQMCVVGLQTVLSCVLNKALCV